VALKSGQKQKTRRKIESEKQRNEWNYAIEGKTKFSA